MKLREKIEDEYKNALKLKDVISEIGSNEIKINEFVRLKIGE